MLVAAAVCPHPPLLVPELAHGAAVELDPLRAACDAAVRELLDRRPDRIVLVGDGPATREHPAGSLGDLARYGAGPRVRLGGWDPAAMAAADGRRVADGESATLPLSLTVGAWLLERAAPSGLSGTRCLGMAVSDRTTPAECARLGARLTEGPDAVGMLVLGDGSACRGERSPGPAHPDAVEFDDTVSQALATADTTALLELSPEVATEVLAAGRASWQVLAGAAAGRGLRGVLRYHEDPYGVAYSVANWV